ncbi:PLP-dependent cysteine synthase family protein [Pseudomonas sp. DWP3-1-2]|uniref:PLP-dependent cysteine synthase family protein n=1 Tax=Pseudomonas sp. DWP3-1-2 TaxID=2804645 RepID=UPI003CEDD48C
MSDWIRTAMRKISCDQQRSADTHMLKLEVPALRDVDIYIKDESTHPSGSLKHRLARSLFLHAICSGKIREGTHVVEASSGSTAVSEAYFAKLLGLRFTAVMPRHTASRKIQQVELLGGRCHFVERACEVYAEAERLAAEGDGHYMDQFTYAERATDWRGNNNIADSIFEQLKGEEHPVPAAIVMSAGTGGTTATIGRFIRYKGHDTRLIVVDPENSVFYESFRTGDISLTSPHGSRIEGIGRPRVEASFLPDVIDDMVQVPDAASIATLGWLERLLGKKPGGSTGTNVWGALTVALQMQERGVKGSVVTLMCDSGERYLDTYYDPQWVTRTVGDLTPYTRKLEQLLVPARQVNSR